MSTKITRSYNMFHPGLSLAERIPAASRDPDCPNYHLYEEMFESSGLVGKKALYLELTATEQFGIEFEASADQVTVRIPAAVWNRIVELGPIDVDGKHQQASGG